MTQWIKIKPAYGMNAAPARTTPAVKRERTGYKAAKLIVPAVLASGERADVFTDKNGRLAFHFGTTGNYSLSRTNGTVRHVTIPSKYAHLIPYGMTDVTLERDGDMLVLDTAPLHA